MIETPLRRIQLVVNAAVDSIVCRDEAVVAVVAVVVAAAVAAAVA